MKFLKNSDGLCLMKGDDLLFYGIKAYIMTEKDEKTYLDLVSATEDTAIFANEAMDADMKVVLSDINGSTAVRIIADYYPEKLFDRKGNLHFYDEHAAGIEMHQSEAMRPSTAIYKHCEFWSRPFFADDLSTLPETTQALMLDFGGFNLFAAALCDKEFKGNFIGAEEGRMSLYVWDNCHSNECDTLAAVFSVGDDWDSLIPFTIENGFRALGREPRLRRDRKFPEVLDYLGWCTWDALHLDVSHEALIQKFEEFGDKKIPVKWVMIDDMWGHVKNNKLGVNSTRELYDFEADPVRFPRGLAAAVSDLKEKYGINVGLWHPTTGYWCGIDMNGNIAKDPQFRELLFLSQFGFWTHSFEEEKIEKYFRLQHRFYKDSGIDFVKIDNQACLRRWAKLVMPIGKAAANMHRAIEMAADEYYDGQLINCMGMPLENFWNRNSAVSRMSCDYLPDSAERFNLLIQQNAFNSMVQGCVYYGDYDMWWTYDSQALKNAAIHSICGGAVYISDEIGKTDYDVLMPLVYSDGRVIKLEDPAKPTRDCMHVNPRESKKPFKVYNRSERGGVVIAYNVDTENGRVEGRIKATDAGLSPDKTYCAYDRFEGTARLVGGNEEIAVSLAHNNEFKMLLFVECEEKAILGLKEKYLCFELVKDGTVSENGTLLLWGADEVTVNGKRVRAASAGDGLFEVKVNKGDKVSL